MDDICKTLYSRNAENIIARSLDIEDFDYWLNKSSEGVSTRNSYIRNGYTYNDSETYTTNNKYPAFYKTQINESDPGTLSDSSSLNRDGDLTAKQTLYLLEINENNFSDGYKVLKGHGQIWLASRYTSCSADKVIFGLRSTSTSGTALFGSDKISSDGTFYGSGAGLCPVVHLKSSVQITPKAGTTSEPHHIESY